MARPIEGGPTIEGEDAEEFLRRMKAGPTKKDKEYNERLKKAAERRRVSFIFNED